VIFELNQVFMMKSGSQKWIVFVVHAFKNTGYSSRFQTDCVTLAA